MMTAQQKNGMSNTRTTDVGACRIAVHVAGAGRPAVLIHGFGGNKSTWQKIVPALAGKFKCYSIDLPGYGDSIAPDDFSYTVEDMSDVLADFVIKENLRNVTLVANSLGSAIALLAAIRRKDLYSRIAAFCIIDGICYPQDFPYFVSLLRLPLLGELITEAVPSYLQVRSVLGYCYYDSRLITSSQVAGYAKPMARPQVREALRKTARAIDAAHLAKYTSAFGTIRLPTLLIWGEADKVVPVELGRRLHQDMRGSTLTIIPNCGHLPQEEKPEAVIAAIEEFERSLSA